MKKSTVWSRKISWKSITSSNSMRRASKKKSMKPTFGRKAIVLSFLIPLSMLTSSYSLISTPNQWILQATNSQWWSLVLRKAPKTKNSSLESKNVHQTGWQLECAIKISSFLKVILSTSVLLGMVGIWSVQMAEHGRILTHNITIKWK